MKTIEVFEIKHDNKHVHLAMTENEALEWLQRHQPFSMDHAIKYEGWSIEKTLAEYAI